MNGKRQGHKLKKTGSVGKNNGSELQIKQEVSWLSMVWSRLGNNKETKINKTANLHCPSSNFSL